jgi:Protein of unknown function (DUF3501)
VKAVKPLTPLEVLPVTTYDRVRPLLRPLCMAEKARRRLAVGQHLTLMFENRQTLWYQIQEVLRAERIFEDAAINHEVETYNELIPRPGELFATLLIEYADSAERDLELARLVGLERHLWMVLDGRRVGARFDDRQMSPDQISAVQFIAFPLGVAAERFEELAAAGKVAIEVDHPHLSVRTPIEGPLAAALTGDLRPD